MRVNSIYLSLKQYLAQIPRQPLSAGELDRWEELLAFLTASEQVADRVVRVLDELQSKKPAGARVYPVEAKAKSLPSRQSKRHGLVSSFAWIAGAPAWTVHLD